MEREIEELGYTRREMERMATTDNSVIPWLMAYAPREQTGISKRVCSHLSVVVFIQEMTRLPAHGMMRKWRRE